MRLVVAGFCVIGLPAFADRMQDTHFSDPDVCYAGQPEGDDLITAMSLGPDFRIPDDYSAGRLAVGTTTHDGAFYISFSTCKARGPDGRFCRVDDGGWFILEPLGPTTLKLTIGGNGMVAIGRRNSILYEGKEPWAEYTLTRSTTEDCT